MRARGFTSLFPDAPGNDIDKFSLSASNPERHPDAPDLFMESGIYVEVHGNVGTDDAYLEVNYVARMHYCCAFARPEAQLDECWKAAAGRDGETFGDFDSGIIDEIEWPEDGSGSDDAEGPPIETEADEIVQGEDSDTLLMERIA